MILFNILLFLVELSALVLIHEFGHFIVAKKSGVKVEEFGLGIPPRVFGKKFGETLYSINALPIGGFVKLFGEEEAELSGRKLTEVEISRSFSHKSTLQKSMIVCAGVFFNFLLGWGIMSYLFTQGVAVPTGRVLVEKVTSGSPAADVGLQKGDILQKISRDSKTITLTQSQDLIAATEQFGGKNVNLTVDRSGKIVEIKVIPRKNPSKNQGALGVVITDTVVKKYSLTQAPYEALKHSISMTTTIAKTIGNALTRLVTLQKQEVELVGPVGIYMVNSKVAENGLIPLLQFVGLLSLNLAFINILPFPALDGGRLVMILYEAVTRRKINVHFAQKLNMIGFAILIGFIILITTRDILNFQHLQDLLK